MLQDDFSGIKLNIEWAKKNIGDVERAIAEFVDSNPWRIETEDDLQAQEKIYRVVPARPLPPLLQPAVTNIIHTLRSSLDHLACALAIRNGHSDARHTYFIISKSKDIFEGEVRKGKIKKLPMAARECMARLQPYNGGNSLLRTLHDLDVEGKHIRLIPIGMGGHRSLSVNLYPDINFATVPHWRPVKIKRSTWMRWDGMNKRIELFATELGADFNPEVHIATSVAFEGIEGLEREPIVTVLNQFVDLVERIVDIFERNFF